MRYAGPLDPKQAAAFWKLGALNADDLLRLAFQWLEEERESEGIAILASESEVTLRDHAELFERCLAELGEAVPSERQAGWLCARTLLQAVASGGDALDAAHDILLLLHYPGASFFPVRNLAHDGSAYAGEELGIEMMLGLYYTLQETDLSKPDVDRLMQELREECLRVLAAFYTEPLSDRTVTS